MLISKKIEVNYVRVRFLFCYFVKITYVSTAVLYREKIWHSDREKKCLFNSCYHMYKFFFERKKKKLSINEKHYKIVDGIKLYFIGCDFNIDN